MQRRGLAAFSLALLGTILVIVAVWADVAGGSLALVWLVMIIGGMAALAGYVMLAIGAAKATQSHLHGAGAAPPVHGSGLAAGQTSSS